MTKLLLIAATAGILVLAPASAARAEPACPPSLSAYMWAPGPNDPPSGPPVMAQGTSALTVTAPAEVPIGRGVAVTINDGPDRYGWPIKSATVELLDAPTGRILATRTYTEKELLDTPTKYVAPFPMGSDPVLARLTYVLDTTFAVPAHPACSGTGEATIAPIVGHSPTVRISSDYLGEMLIVKIGRPGGCGAAAVRPVRIVVRGAGRRTTYAIPDVCGKSMYRYGPPPERLALLSLYPRLEFYPSEPRRSYRRTYRVRVSIGGRTTLRRRVLVDYSYFPASRVWEGTDRFVNYCINEGKRLRSSGGRLFCVDPPLRLTTLRVRRP